MGRFREYEEIGRRAAAIAATAVLVVGLLAALTVDPSSETQRLRAAAPPTTAPVEVETTTTLAPVPTTTTVVAPPPSTTVARPRTTTTVAPASTSSDPKPGRYPGSLSFPFQAGRSSWSGKTNGFDLLVEVDNPRPRNGEPVTFTMTAINVTYKCCALGLGYGDHGIFFQGGDCPAPGESPRSVTAKATHVYNKAGRWQFEFTAATRECAGPEYLHGYLWGWIEVAPGGPTTSQGPSLPSFKGVGRLGFTQYDNDPSWVAVHAQATDVDGYIFKLVIDYGDGATETVPEKDMGCRQSSSGWPSESFMQTPTNPPPAHQYAARGTYTITVTAYSQGCDGRDVQQGSASFDWTY